MAAKPGVCSRSALVYSQYSSLDCMVSLLSGFEWVLSVCDLHNDFSPRVGRANLMRVCISDVSLNLSTGASEDIKWCGIAGV